MSGFVAVIGEKQQDECLKMLDGIRHRGPDIFGVSSLGATVIGQNYLPADLNGSRKNQGVPLARSQPVRQMIGYDGQLGNFRELCRRLAIEPGHYMDATGKFIPFASLPESPPATLHANVSQCIEDIRRIIESSIQDRIDFSFKTASLLSGGIDSSVIAMLASRIYKDKFGDSARLPTFALGVGESEDIQNARLVAKHIDSDHHELIVDLDEVLATLDQTVYHLESFDPSLVRSAVSNFLITKHARKQGIEVLLSGEGGDEVFCGYMYLKKLGLDQQFRGQIDCLKFLHSNASLRLDHMNQCHQIRVVAPLISGTLLDYALSMPPEFKQMPEGEDKIEKWIFRKTFEADLPKEVVWRLKAEFSQGSGSAGLLPDHFEKVVDDRTFNEARSSHPVIRSKEEYYYFKLFVKHFGDGHTVDTVGQWITL